MNDKEKTDKLFKEVISNYENKRLKEVIGQFTKIIEINPENAIAYNSRGSAYHKKGEYNNAVQDFTKAIEIAEKNNTEVATVYYNRGLSHSKLNKNNKAVQDFTKVIEINPLYAMAYYQRGRSYEQQGEKDKMKADFKKATDLDPGIEDFFKLSKLEGYINHLKKLLYGFEDEYKGTKKEVRGYVELKEKFFNLSYWWFSSILLLILVFTIVSYACPHLACFFDSIKYVLKNFSPLSILLVSPLPFFIHSFLKYRSLEIKITNPLRQR